MSDQDRTDDMEETEVEGHKLASKMAANDEPTEDGDEVEAHKFAAKPASAKPVSS